MQQISADYLNEDLKISMVINYSIDEDENVLVAINGAVTETEGMTYIGNFNGSTINGEMQYNFSGIKDLARLDDIASCLIDIQNKIEPTNNE